MCEIEFRIINFRQVNVIVPVRRLRAIGRCEKIEQHEIKGEKHG
jgi:hypothetical protein